MRQRNFNLSDHFQTAKKPKLSGAGLKIVPALFAAILPKCPLCLAAYLSVFGTFGVSPLLYGVWILPAALVFSVLTIILLFLQARKIRRFPPFYPSLFAPVFILAGKFYFDSVWLIYAGTLLLIISSIWLSTAKKERIACENCS